MIKKPATIAFLAAGIAATVLIGLFFGWEKSLYAIVGVGVGLGAFVGISAGNRSAKKTDEYRENLIRKKSPNRNNDA